MEAEPTAQWFELVPGKMYVTEQERNISMTLYKEAPDKTDQRRTADYANDKLKPWDAFVVLEVAVDQQHPLYVWIKLLTTGGEVGWWGSWKSVRFKRLV